MPMASVSALTGWNPIPIPTPSTMQPIQTAAIPSLCTNLLIYLLSGVSSSSAPMANPAICPMKLRSPVNMTIPFPLPPQLRVEKKAIFFVYNGF